MLVDACGTLTEVVSDAREPKADILGRQYNSQWAAVLVDSCRTLSREVSGAWDHHVPLRQAVNDQE